MNLNNFQQKELQQMEQEIGQYQYQSNNNNSTFGTIDDVLTTMVMNRIEERFENVYILYYYMKIQMRLQIKDAQIRTSVTNTHEKVIIINLGLHLKGSDDKYLYGIIIMDDILKQQQYKFVWQIDQFLSADRINTKYGLDIASLPAPSTMSYFKDHLNKKDIDRLINRYNHKQLTLNNGQHNGYKLVIDRAEWQQLLKQELNNDAIPWIPVILDNNGTLNIAHIKIIHIPSKDVYIGIQLERGTLPKKLRTILPPEIVQYIHQYTERLSIISDPQSIVHASAAASLSRSISLADMNQYSQKWVNDVQVCDLNKTLTNIAEKHKVKPEYVIQSFAENDAKRGFSALMKQHGITRGSTLKIYYDIERLGLVSSGSSDNIQLDDFSDHWEQVLKQQHISQQEYLDQLIEAVSIINNGINHPQDNINNNNISITNNTSFTQTIQQMMHYFDQDMDDVNVLREQNERYHQNYNDINQQYMNYVSHSQQVSMYLY